MKDNRLPNLVFDFGKVLVDYDFDAFFLHHIPDPVKRREFFLLLNNEHMQDVVDRELLPFDETIARMISLHPEFADQLALFRDHYPEIVTTEVPGMRELLTRLKAEGFSLYGLTNWCSRIYYTMRQYPIFQLLDGQVISSEEHIIKPEPDIYLRLCQRYHLRPEDCFFTDDRDVNVQGAIAVGMAAVRFDNALQYESALRNYLKSL